MKTNLLAFLKDDVSALIGAINNNPELAKMEATTTDSGFKTLGDFANYWEVHLNSISQ